jgi:cell wall-associated NlpC family hydrolase
MVQMTARSLFFIVFAACPVFAAFQRSLVVVPVADVRRHPGPPVVNSDEETQVLFGEAVDVIKSSGPWSYVNVPDQPKYVYENAEFGARSAGEGVSHQNNLLPHSAFRTPHWQGYPGWVFSKSLSPESEALKPNAIITRKWLPVTKEIGGTLWMQLPLGARVFVFKTDHEWSLIDLGNGAQGWALTAGMRELTAFPKASRVRKDIIQTAEFLTGDPYLWGGRSPYDSYHPEQLSGVDCSGLVHLSYIVNGVEIPRDAMEQYMKAEKIKPADLRPADLIFSAPLKEPGRITHVSLFAGKGWVIEAPQTGQTVRKIRFEEKFGKALDSVHPGDRLQDRVIYFGRLLKE